MSSCNGDDIELGNLEEKEQLLISDNDGKGDQQHRCQSRGRGSAGSDQIYNSSSSHLSTTPDEASNSRTPLAEIWNRRYNHIRILNTQLLEAVEDRDSKEVERLLRAGAQPDATCRLAHVSACHLAALEGGDVLAVLLKFGAVKDRRDECGRRPIHLAAWSESTREIAILLGLPEELQDKVANNEMTLETEENVKKMSPQLQKVTNVQCEPGVFLELSGTWKDSISHSCRDTRDNLPYMDIGWTPLHAASSNARPHCVRLLLAAGADPGIRDSCGRTPVDVAGTALYQKHDFTVECFREVIKMLLEVGSTLTTDPGATQVDSSLHVAVMLENVDAIRELLDAGASVTGLDRNGQTPLHICVKKRLKKHLQVLANHNNIRLNTAKSLIDVENVEGYSALHIAVTDSWVPGVCVALEAGADITVKRFKNKTGQTPLHTAAQLGNLDVLKEILNVIKHSNAIDCLNEDGVTALFPAIVSENIKCVKELLNAGVSIKKCASNNFNVLHLAARNGYVNILDVLLNHDSDATECMLNERDSEFNFTPILYATSNYHIQCFKLLFSKEKQKCSRTNTRFAVLELMLEAIRFDRSIIANELIYYDKSAVHPREDLTFYYNPFEYAIYQGSIYTLKLLITNGASLLTYVNDTGNDVKRRITGLASIFSGPFWVFKLPCDAEVTVCRKMDKPTEFLENIFDELIITNDDLNIQDATCAITIDYNILTPDECETEMKVLKAFIETGHNNGQQKLLLHPLVESFIYLKWLTLKSFFYVIVFFMGLLVLSVNIFIVSFYYCKDTGEPVPEVLDPGVWRYIVYVSVSIVAILECMKMKINSIKLYFKIYKIIFVVIIIALPSTIAAESLWDAEWPRHGATVVLLISWLEMMSLFSQTPYAGYYVLMFIKVAEKVVKILLVFIILIFAFALSFEIQFHSREPFQNPWAAFVKTMVMMSSEFDYSDTFANPNNTETNMRGEIQEVVQKNPSILACRILFIFFLILTAIVLMNLILGVAVNDLHNLVMKRKIKRLQNQIMFLDSLETLYNVLPNYLKNDRRVKRKVLIRPSVRRDIFPKYIIESIYKHVQAQQEIKDDERYFLTDGQKLSKLKRLRCTREFMKSMFGNIPGGEKTDDCEIVLQHLDEVNIELNQVHVKLDQMSSKMKSMKQMMGK